MKKIFIYYSYTGNGELVASTLKEQGYELRRFQEKKKMPKSFFGGMMVGGFRAGLGLKGKLVNFDNDISNYDEIVIGSPIWNGRLTPATNGLLNQLDLKDKKVTFVLYSGSGTGKHAVKKLNKLFNNVKIIFLQEPKKYNEELNKLKEI